MKNDEIAKLFRFEPGTTIRSLPTRWAGLDDARKHRKDAVKRIARLQEKLFADDRFALLLIFQGMDAAGKDSTIKKVTTGVNPAGFETHSFKAPTYEHNDHNFLWRHWRLMPAKGHIGIFNRSYYEEVLVVRVHPELVLNQQLANRTVNDAFWAQRYRDFTAMEEHLCTNGVVVLKFFLNVSKDEQRKRLLARLDEPAKHWKFNPRDVDEREHWDEYQAAFQDAIDNTHTQYAPWYVIPADDKTVMQAIVAGVIADTLEKLPLEYPAPDPSEMALFERAKLLLLATQDENPVDDEDDEDDFDNSED
ncbi:MAG: polyphosphate kinase 2 family protein [Pseudomonadales bacterium]